MKPPGFFVRIMKLKSLPAPALAGGLARVAVVLLIDAVKLQQLDRLFAEMIDRRGEFLGDRPAQAAARRA